MKILDGTAGRLITRRIITGRLTAGKMIGGFVILALLASHCAVALPRPQAPAAQPGTEPLPDSPSAGQQPATEPATEKEKVEPQSESAPPPAPQGNQYQKPVGTAAAETSSTTGFAASKPAGEALAPAKQKRSRTLIISLAAVVGAAVAVGTVAALSKGTSSKPPGAQ
jgi:hypothetical protein